MTSQKQFLSYYESSVQIDIYSSVMLIRNKCRLCPSWKR